MKTVKGRAYMGFCARLAGFIAQRITRQVMLAAGLWLTLSMAQADVRIVSLTQTPANDVTPGAEVSYNVTVRSALTTSDTTPDFVQITIQSGNTNISAQFTPAPGQCNLDGRYFCGQLGFGETQTYSFSWTPPAGTQALSFLVSCSSIGSSCTGDSRGITTQVVEPVPVAADDSVTTHVGQAVTINVLDNDTPPPGRTLRITGVTTPSQGTAVINDGTTITYTPAAGYVGPDRFSYTVTDTAGRTATASVAVNVASVPIAADDTAVSNAGQAVTVNVLDNDLAPPDQTLSISAVTAPSHGTTVINNGTSITYTPAAGYVGPDRFSYTVIDNAERTATASVAVSVVVPAATAIGLAEIPGLTENQASLAAAIDRLCDSTDSAALQSQCASLSSLSVSEQRIALAQLTPDQLAAQGTLAVESTGAQLNNVRARIQSLRRGSSGLGLRGLSIQVAGLELPAGLLADAAMAQGGTGDGASQPLWADGRLGAFVNGRVLFGTQDSSSRQAGFDFDTRGLTLGVDYRYTKQTVVGGALGYSSTGSDFAAGRGDMDTRGFTASLYGSYYTPSSYFLDWIVNYGGNSYDTRRTIVYSGVNTSASGDTDSSQWGATVNTGADFSRGNLLLSPYLRLEYIDTRVDGYTEQGGAGWALAYQEQTVRSLTTALGGRVSWALSQPWGVLTPSVSADWEHQYKDGARALSVRFAADPSVPFTLQTDAPDRDYANLGISLAATLPGGKAAFVSYQTVLGQNYTSVSTIDLGIRLEF